MTPPKIGQNQGTFANSSWETTRPFATVTTDQLAKKFIEYSDATFGTYRDDQDRLYEILKEVEYRGPEEKKAFTKFAYHELKDGFQIDYYLDLDRKFREEFKSHLSPDFIRGALIRKNLGPCDRTQLARLLEAYEGKEIYKSTVWEARFAGIKNVVDQSRQPGTFWSISGLFALLPPQGKLMLGGILGILSFKHGSEKIEQNVAKSLVAKESSKEEMLATEGIMEGFVQTVLPFLTLFRASGLRTAQTSSPGATPLAPRPSNLEPTAPFSLMIRDRLQNIRGRYSENSGMVLKQNGSQTSANGLTTETQTSFQVIPSTPRDFIKPQKWNMWAPPPKVVQKANPNQNLPENYDMPGVKGAPMGTPKIDPNLSIIGFPGMKKPEEPIGDKPAYEATIGDNGNLEEKYWMGEEEAQEIKLKKKNKKRSFIENGVTRILEQISQGYDRGLFVSPMGLREITEELLRNLLSNENHQKVLLVVQGKENQERWRKRLEIIFEAQRQVGNKDRDIWEKNHLSVQLASIHELSRMSSRSLKRLLQEINLMILDKEHHIRPAQDDPSDHERSRFIRLLIEGGFLTKNYELQRNPEKFLLGLTETVTEGAGRIYGGKEGLIESITLPDLLALGFVNKPEVRIVVPKVFPQEQHTYLSWESLSLEERNQHTIEIIRSLDEELKAGDKIPRMVVYAGSREEAARLAEQLDADLRFKNKIALMISGTADLEDRRKEDLREFFTGTKSIAIHVETMVEGVDEFQQSPVDAVILSSPEYASSLQYALQVVGAHLVTEDPPLIIDQSGMFLKHPDLTSFDPTLYILEEGRIRSGGSLERAGATRKEVQKTSQGNDILLIDIFGEGVGKNLAEVLTQITNSIPRSLLALQMGWSEEFLDQLISGEFIPSSRLTIEKIAEVLSLTAEESDQLLASWAQDKAKLYEKRFPTPKELSEGEKIILQSARVGLIKFYGGILATVKGSTGETIKRYLEMGKMPTYLDDRQNFLQILAKIISGPQNETEGMAIIREHLGVSYTREYWQPRNVENLLKFNSEQLQSLFEGKKDDQGNLPQEIIWQYLPQSNNTIISPTPYRIEEWNRWNEQRQKSGKRDIYGRIFIRKIDEGKFEIFHATGQKAQVLIDTLRKSHLAEDQKLLIPPDWYLGLKPLSVEDFKGLSPLDFERLFVSKKDEQGILPLEIVLQYLPLPNNTFASFILYHPKEWEKWNEQRKNEGKVDHYSRIWIRRLEEDKIEIFKVSGKKAQEVTGAIRQSVLLNPKLIIRSDGWLNLKPFSINGDLHELSISDLNNWFESKKDDHGNIPKEIVWQYLPQRRDNSLSSPTPYRLEEWENWKRERVKEGQRIDIFGRTWIRRINKEQFEIFRIEGQKSFEVLDSLRKSKVAKSQKLLIPPNWHLGLKPLSVEDLKSLSSLDFEMLFTSKKDEQGNLPTEIVWQFLSYNNLFTSPTPYRIEEWNRWNELREKSLKYDHYGRIWIRRLGKGRFELLRQKSKGKKASVMIQALQQSSLSKGENPVLKIVADD